MITGKQPPQDGTEVGYYHLRGTGEIVFETEQTAEWIRIDENSTVTLTEYQ